MTTAERRFSKLKLCLIPGIVLTVMTYLLGEFQNPNNALLETLSLVVIIANIVLIIFSGTIFYLKDLVLAPFRIFNGFGTLGFLIAIFIFFALLALALLISVFVPILSLLYALLCTYKTIKSE